MEYRISRVSVGQLTKLSCVLYACMGVIFIPIFIVMSLVDPEVGIFGIGFALVMPVIYAALGALTGTLGAVLYNWAAGMFGGVELNLDVAAPALAATQQTAK